MRATRIAPALPILLVLLASATVVSLARTAAAAEEPTTLALEIAVTHGKASVASDKRSVHKYRVEVTIGGTAVRVENRVATQIAMDGANGGTVSELVPIGASLDVTARASGGGAVLLYVSLDDQAAVPLPLGGLGAAGVKARFGVRGLAVDTVVSMPIAKEALLELAAIDDPVADRAWLVTARITAVTGGAWRTTGTAPLNSFFVAHMEEGADKTATSTTARVTVAPDSTGRVADQVSLPIATDTDKGRHVQFIPFSVGMNASAGGAAHTWSVEVGTARLRTTLPGGAVVKEGVWEQRNAYRMVTLTPGSGVAELGSVENADGKNAFHATVEITKRE